MWHSIFSHADFWAILSIPPVTMIVTWAHVGMALWMLFYPIRFWGIPIKGLPWGLHGIGWIGIVPSKAGKISGVIVDQTLSKLGSLDEFFQAMRPDEMARCIASAIDENLETLIDDIMFERIGGLWGSLPYAARRRLYAHVHEQLPRIVQDMVLDLTDNVENLVDMRQMIVARMQNNPKLMVDMFLRVGKKEIDFIWQISAVIGFWFGVLQMALFILIPQHWTVPFFAAIWGVLTNWIAIWMVFHPVEPVVLRAPRMFVKKGRFFIPCRWHMHNYILQGGFMKRQAEVSSVFADIVVKELVTLENIMHEMMYGIHASDTRQVMKTHLYQMLDTPIVETTLRLSLGENEFLALKDTILDKSIAATMTPIRDPKLNQSRAQKIYGLFKERLLALSPHEFQNLLRPAFKEDELTLIILGGITGFLAGWLHLVVAFF